MDEIIWSDEKYSVGNPQIDSQHKVLIKHLNALIKLQKQRFGQAQQRKILKDLEQYVEKHLRFEEALLKKIRYPAFHEHEQLHSEYMMEIEMWTIMLEDSDPELPKRMCRFLKSWLTNHILGEDMKFKAYLKSKS